LLLLTSFLAMAVVTPFAFVASVGRGYLLPIGVALLALIAANLLALAGWGEYFPWAVPGLVAQGTELTPVSYVIVALTALAGMLATYAWWMRADQNR
jgi:ABC-2 type transport system permease protein